MGFQDFVIIYKNNDRISAIHENADGGIIVCNENNSTYQYIYRAGEKFLLITVDGGLIKRKDTKKCDYLLLNITDDVNLFDIPHSIFIELKGTNLERAYQQILATIDECQVDLSGSRFHARIVVSRLHPPQYATCSQKYKVEFKKRNCSFPEPQERELTEHTGKDGNPTKVIISQLNPQDDIHATH